MLSAVKFGFIKYFDFAGRASRSEYWYWVLFIFLVSVLLIMWDTFYYGLFSLITFIPSMSVLIRRLHDTNRSGWWYLIALVPVVGGVVLLVFLLMRSYPEENQFGMPWWRAKKDLQTSASRNENPVTNKEHRPAGISDVEMDRRLKAVKAAKVRQDAATLSVLADRSYKLDMSSPNREVVSDLAKTASETDVSNELVEISSSSGIPSEPHGQINETTAAENNNGSIIIEQAPKNNASAISTNYKSSLRDDLHAASKFGDVAEIISILRSLEINVKIEGNHYKLELPNGTHIDLADEKLFVAFSKKMCRDEAFPFNFV